jgi:hypothetical protein
LFRLGFGFGFGFAELVVVVVIIKTLYKQALLVHW